MGSQKAALDKRRDILQTKRQKQIKVWVNRQKKIDIKEFIKRFRIQI